MTWVRPEPINRNIPEHGWLTTAGVLPLAERPTIWVTHMDRLHYELPIDVDEEDGPLISAKLLEPPNGNQAIEMVFANMIRLQFPGPDGRWRDETAIPPGGRPALQPA